MTLQEIWAAVKARAADYQTRLNKPENLDLKRTLIGAGVGGGVGLVGGAALGGKGRRPGAALLGLLGGAGAGAGAGFLTSRQLQQGAEKPAGGEAKPVLPPPKAAPAPLIPAGAGRLVPPAHAAGGGGVAGLTYLAGKRPADMLAPGLSRAGVSPGQQALVKQLVRGGTAANAGLLAALAFRPRPAAE